MFSIYRVLGSLSDAHCTSSCVFAEVKSSQSQRRVFTSFQWTVKLRNLILSEFDNEFDQDCIINSVLA